MTARCRAFVEAEKVRQVATSSRRASCWRCPVPPIYRWHQHTPSARALSDAELTEKIRADPRRLGTARTGRPGFMPSWPRRVGMWAENGWPG